MDDEVGMWFAGEGPHRGGVVYRQTYYGRETIATCDRVKTAEIIAEALNFYEDRHENKTFQTPLKLTAR